MQVSDLEKEADTLIENRSEEFSMGAIRTLETIMELCVNSDEQCLRREDIEVLMDFVYDHSGYY